MKKMYRKEKFTNFTDWYRARAIGGSSASALFGVNKHTSKLDLYCAMVSKPNELVEENGEIEDRDTVSTLRGKALEPIIRAFLKQRFKGKYKLITPNGFTMYRRIDKPYMTATLDGIIIDLETGEKWILEIKTHLAMGKEDMAEWENQVPQKS